MSQQLISTDSYFDGQRLHDAGPYHLLIDDKTIKHIAMGDCPSAWLSNATQRLECRFAMPGLVEAHCHLFLDGGELDFTKRSAYFETGFDDMLEVARNNVAAHLTRGITLIRDAGDKYGINHAIRDEINQQYQHQLIRSPGLALRRPKKYGGFMAREVESHADIITAINEIAENANDLKIILTGIIDFELGAVTKAPQFGLDDVELMVKLAGELGLPTFAHCSGIEGVRIAVAAGVNSIEHGFFMDKQCLQVMADKQIAWVPTFSPVYFQWAHPEYANWDEQTVSNLRRIIDEHLLSVAMAVELGVPLVAGSDAGSYGVEHGKGLIDELMFFHQAGIPMDEILRCATSRPRQLWGAESANIVVGNMVNVILMSKSPFEDLQAFRSIDHVIYNETYFI